MRSSSSVSPWLRRSKRGAVAVAGHGAPVDGGETAGAAFSPLRRIRARPKRARARRTGRNVGQKGKAARNGAPFAGLIARPAAHAALVGLHAIVGDGARAGRIILGRGLRRRARVRGRRRCPADLRRLVEAGGHVGRVGDDGDAAGVALGGAVAGRPT